MYKIKGNSVIRLADNANIPNDPANSDWAAYKVWCNKGNTAQPEFGAEELLIQRRTAIADRRFKAEIAGISVGGVSVYTDRTTQNKLTATAFRAARDPSYTVDWKTLDGSFVTLTSDLILHVADAVGDYVQACYTREGILGYMLTNGTYTDSMLEEGWPAQEIPYVAG